MHIYKIGGNIIHSKLYKKKCRNRKVVSLKQQSKADTSLKKTDRNRRSKKLSIVNREFLESIGLTVRK